MERVCLPDLEADQTMAVGHYDVCYVAGCPICPIRTSPDHAIPSLERNARTARLPGKSHHPHTTTNLMPIRKYSNITGSENLCVSNKFVHTSRNPTFF